MTGLRVCISVLLQYLLAVGHVLLWAGAVAIYIGYVEEAEVEEKQDDWITLKIKSEAVDLLDLLVLSSKNCDVMKNDFINQCHIYPVPHLNIPPTLFTNGKWEQVCVCGNMMGSDVHKYACNWTKLLWNKDKCTNAVLSPVHAMFQVFHHDYVMLLSLISTHATTLQLQQIVT